MQGRQNMSNTERKGPHKSMHCKFCKPPGVVTPEKPTRAQLETKTKIHLAHEAADLRVCNIHNEMEKMFKGKGTAWSHLRDDRPGFSAVESEACICVLEGENACPKCIPDKKKPPPKKKVCRCPKGAKPHPSMFNAAAPKKKKQVDEDEEFWWEKYSREHDALAKETWAAYMAQRRKDKKLEKCQKREKEALAKKKTKGIPLWYQKLSCQQMIYVEYLSTAIRLDSDENITDRTHFVLGGIGLHPRPKRKVLKRCLRYCHYNSIQFLNQLHLLIKEEDPFQEKRVQEIAEEVFTWNERLIMNSMCYLEFPALLRELMDRLPPLPRAQMLPLIPYPVFPALPKKKYNSPYEEPIWQDRLNWVEKSKIDRLNRCRLHMETKRVKIPPLALVRRPSLIDARPPFLAQIEANERASRRLVKEKGRKQQRKHPIPTFNSAVDVTAIAGIEASEISTTDKADTEDICVFLRDPKEPQSMEEEGEGEGEMEETEFLLDRDVRFMEEPAKSETQVGRLQVTSDVEDCSMEGEGAEDIPFKTPPKTESGATIASPCPPPDTTPGPPALHFDRAKREMDVRNEEICGFFPFVTSSTQTVKEEICDRSNDVEFNLKSAAEKLKRFADENEGEERPRKEKENKKSKKGKCRKNLHKSKSKKTKSYIGKKRVKTPNSIKEKGDEGEEEEGDGKDVPNDGDEEEDEEGGDGIQISFKIEKGSDKKGSQRESEASDPDPETDDEWSTRPPCTSGKSEDENPGDAEPRRRTKKRKGKGSRQKTKRKKVSNETKERRTVEYKKREPRTRTEKEMMTELGYSNARGKEAEKEDDREVEEFTGDVDPLVQQIIKDLAEEGFYCASYPLLSKHPDVDQLILHLKGEIVNKELRDLLLAATKTRWNRLKGLKKFPVAELGISIKRAEKANWNDKRWISRLAKLKTAQFYYNVANGRSAYAAEFYNTLYQAYFGTERYLKIFYAYMPSKYEDCILRGIF